METEKPININISRTNDKEDKYNELIDGEYSYIETWKKAIHGYMFSVDEGISFSTSRYFELFFISVSAASDPFMAVTPCFIVTRIM